MPNCIILRGLPGSGKSTLAKAINKGGYYIISADDFFYHKGEYRFEGYRLYQAHADCYKRFYNIVTLSYNIILDNTNITKKEYSRYVELAESLGYDISIITIDTTHTDEELAERNIHGVHVETIKRMRERMKHG